jgi:hypothetical protein
MSDRLGIAHRPVVVTPVSGDALNDLKKRLNVLEAELRHMITAIKDMKNGINAANSRLLTSGVMNSRNWALSVIMSHCYIQSFLGANPGQGNTYQSARFYLYDMFKRAAEMGANDAIETRRRLNVRPTDNWAQVNWDGKIL